MVNTKEIDIKIPEIFRPFIKRSRYKVARGGRGAAKSWTTATLFILKAIKKKIRILCCRENQNSIKESVHKLLVDTIGRLDLDDLFYITDHTIKCVTTGSDFIFIGLKNNINKLKSYEGVDFVWIEEGENISGNSLDILIPTIRKTEKKVFENIEDLKEYLLENPELDFPEYVNEDELTLYLPSEIWILFNPNYEDDEVYSRFVRNTPESCISIECTYFDSPYFPPTLRKEMEECKASDQEKYKHIWLGQPTGAGLKIYSSKFEKKIHIDTETTRDTLLERLGKEGHCFMSIDPHSSYYPACVWIALVLNEHREWEKIIYNEFPTFEYFGSGWYADLRKKKRLELNLKELAQVIYSYDGTEYGIEIKKRFVDSRYAKGSGGSNVMTNADGMIETWKIPENGSMNLITPQEKIIDVQRQNILTDLSYNKNIQTSLFNKPRLKIMPWCKNIINSLENHRETLDGKREDEKFKDFSDALRIVYAGTIGYPIPSTYKKKRRNRQAGWMS